MPQTTARKAGTWVVICSGLVITWEGTDLVAYPDRLANGLPTVCNGVTKSEVPGLKVGDKYSAAQCAALLQKNLPVYDAGVQKCVHVPMSQPRRAAVDSMAWNIGIAGVCKSTFVKHLNAGDPDACKYMAQYDMASGKHVRGLALRRADEITYCNETDAQNEAFMAGQPPVKVVQVPVPKAKPVAIAPPPAPPPPTFWQRVKHFIVGEP